MRNPCEQPGHWGGFVPVAIVLFSLPVGWSGERKREGDRDEGKTVVFDPELKPKGGLMGFPSTRFVQRFLIHLTLHNLRHRRACSGNSTPRQASTGLRVAPAVGPEGCRWVAAFKKNGKRSGHTSSPGGKGGYSSRQGPRRQPSGPAAGAVRNRIWKPRLSDPSPNVSQSLGLIKLQ